MRIDVKKVLFMGLKKNKEAFFRRAQEIGVVQFIDPSPRKGKETPQEIVNTTNAIKVLRGLPTLEQEEHDDYTEADTIAGTILQLHGKIEQCHEESRVLRQEIERVDPFGEFSIDALRNLEHEAGRVVQFFFAKHSADVPAASNDEVIYIDSDHGLDYYIAINTSPKTYEGMVEMKVEKSADALRAEATALNESVHELEKRLKGYAKWNDFLHEALIDKMNTHNLVHTQEYVDTALDGHLFAVEGWVAHHKDEELAKLLNSFDVTCEEIAVEESDTIPTYLENRGFARIGEDLVHIYDTPSVDDKDPSLWVFYSFALFFAIILADGGYGVIFLLIALYLRYAVSKPSAVMKRVTTLVTTLSITCIGWGILTNSFFGIQFTPDSWAYDYSGVQRLVESKAAYHMAERDDVYESWTAKFPALRSVQNPILFLNNATVERDGDVKYLMRDKFYDNIMLELALLIGVIHISLSFLRSIRTSWAGLGWIAFMVGGYLFFPIYLNATSLLHFTGMITKATAAEAGMELIYGGIGAAVVLAILQYRLGGLGEIINIIQVFADVLSYLRLYALGLAGSMMSATFNDIGGSMPIVAGLLVILIGHVVNIALSVMGGVIHGLRLNFLEWYHYSFEGGGKMFKPLSLLKIK